eukprot:424090_1
MDDFEEVWHQYETQYTTNSQELQQLIRVVPTITKSQRDDYQQQGNECMRNIERAVTDLAQTLRQNRSITTTQKDKYRQQLNVYKAQQKSSRNNFQTAMQKQRYSSYSTYEKEERKGLLQGNEIIDSTQSALDQSKQIVAETEEVAIDTSGKVNAQGQQLEHVLGDLHDITDTSARARRIMLGMAR